jgi:flagellar basal-body rod protein FlgB
MERLDGSGRNQAQGGRITFVFSMSLLDSTQQALESAMSGSALRNTLLANNLANVDTPGYQPQDVNFQATLQAAIQSGTPMSQVAFQPYSVQQAVGPDGNGVSPEQTQAALSENGLLYETLTQIAAQREHILQAAMGSGQS